MRIVAALAVLLCLLSGKSVTATPESRAGALFLLISPSGRVDGMGTGGVALADEPGGIYNPATSPLANPDHVFQSNFGSRPWLTWLASDISYSYRSLQLALPVNSFTRGNPNAVLEGVRLSLHAHSKKLDFGTRVRTDERGNAIGFSNAYDSATALGFGLGYTGLIDVGVGATAKKITSVLVSQPKSASAFAFDYGIIFGLPIIQSLEKIRGVPVEGAFYPTANVYYGIAWKNQGGAKINFGDVSQADPLPSNYSRGWSMQLGLTRRLESSELDLAKFTMTGETYYPTIDGHQPSENELDDKAGWEIELINTIGIRRGQFSDIDGELTYDTEGLTVKSDGLFQLASDFLKRGYNYNNVKTAKALAYMLDRLSVSWTKTKHNGKEGFYSPIEGESYAQLGFSF